ncbi:MAG: hypothetical protein ACI9N0_003127 [Ilumatobacter sp.]
MNRGAVIISACGLIAAGGIVGAVIVNGDVTSDRSPQIEVEWEQPAPTVPRVDGFELADVHANSRLEFDECRADYVDTGTGRTVGRNPQYFC